MLVFSLSLLVAIAYAQDDPSTITSAPDPTATATLRPGEVPWSCTNTLRMYCAREYFPWFADGAVEDSEWTDPYSLYHRYDLTDEERNKSVSCRSQFYTAYNDYYMTAEITFGEVIGPETVAVGYTSFTTQILSAPEFISTGVTTETVIATVQETTGPGDFTTVVTYISEGVQYTKSVTEVVETFIYTNALDLTTTLPFTTITNPSGSGFTYAAHTPATYVKNFVFTASRGSGCCQDCSLIGDNVEVFYWPTPAPSGAEKTLVNSNNFTFAYPTAYIAVASLYATDLCGTLTPSVVTATTIAIPEENLSTAIAYRFNSTQYHANPPTFYPLYTKADFQAAETISCYDVTTSYWLKAYNATLLTSSETSADLYTVTYNPCSPTLSVPTELYTINEAWKTCVPGINGLYDPPSFLVPGKGLTTFDPSTTTAIPETSPSVPDPTTTPSTTSATQGPTITAVTPTPTATVVPVDPTTSVEVPPPADPTSADPDPPADPTTAPADPTDPAPGNGGDPDTSTPVVVDPTNPPADPTDPAPGNGGDPATSLPVIIDPTTPPADPTQAPGGNGGGSGGNGGDPGTDTTPAAGGGSNPAPPTLIIGTQTLAPGGPAITVSGTVLSLPPTGSSIVVNGNTADSGSFFSSEAAPEFVIGASQTLKQGASAITISGTLVSLMPGGSSVVVGSVTEALSSLLGTATTATQDGIGAVIATIGGFTTVGADGTGSNGTYYVPASAGDRGVAQHVWVWGAALGAGLIGVAWL